MCVCVCVSVSVCLSVFCGRRMASVLVTSIALHDETAVGISLLELLGGGDTVQMECAAAAMRALVSGSVNKAWLEKGEGCQEIG